MSEPTIVLNEDAMEDAWLQVRPKATAKKMPPPAHPQTVEWVTVERRRRVLEQDLQQLVSRGDRLRQQILERWSMDGTQRESVAGQTVHLKRKLYPKVADRAALTVALQEEGLTNLMTVDDKAFAAYVTQCDEEGRPLPDSIAEHITDRFERFALAVKLT